MSKRTGFSTLGVIAALALLIVGCGSDGEQGVAAAQGQVRPADAGSVSGVGATPQPDASVIGAIVPRLDGQPGVAVAIYLDVPGRGVSGIDVAASVIGGAFVIDGVTPGALSGDDVLVAVAGVHDAGASARLAFARKGVTLAEGVSGEAAVVLLNTVDAEAIVRGLTVVVWITDAGFVLHGPFEVVLDGDGL
jgi:hypothetical protein